MIRVSDFRPTYKAKQKFKKFFFPNFFKTSPQFSTFSVDYFYKNIPIGIKPKSFLMPRISVKGYFNRLFFRKKRTVFKIIVVSKKYFFVNQMTIVVIKRLMAPFVRGQQLKKATQIFFTKYSTFNFTKKPLAVRIGGGVGKKIRKTGFFVQPGSVIITIYTKNPIPIYNRLNRLRKKFSGSTSILLF